MSRRPAIFGLLLVLLALVAQVGAASVVPGFDRTADLAAISTICHADDDGGGAGTPAPAHHTPACDLCPLCGPAGGSHLAISTTRVSVPPPVVRPVESPIGIAPATAPPARPRIAAEPRGPPLHA